MEIHPLNREKYVLPTTSPKRDRSHWRETRRPDKSRERDIHLGEGRNRWANDSMGIKNRSLKGLKSTILEANIKHKTRKNNSREPALFSGLDRLNITGTEGEDSKLIFENLHKGSRHSHTWRGYGYAMDLHRLFGEI